MTEYANGADGTCQTCGAPTAEAWHAYCRECWAEEQGCRPRRNDEREGAAAVTAVSDAFGDCVDRGRRLLLYPYRRTLRLCIDCLHERRQGGGAA